MTITIGEYMSELTDYIESHTRRTETAAAGAVDLVFFHVAAVQSADAEMLKRLMAAHNVSKRVAPLDGKEHRYIELGAWLGGEEIALRLIGLGAVLGLWKLHTPKTVLGNVMKPSDEEMLQMAESGLVTVTAIP